MNALKRILAHNLIATLYFNFKMLPFGQAIKLPFDFYYRVRFENLSGRIKLNCDKLKRGMIKIGSRGSDMFPRSSTVIDIKGLVIFNGYAELGHGSLLRVEKCGKIEFGKIVRIGARALLFCEKEMIFKDDIDFSWDCQLFDTNFHHLKDVVTNELDDKTVTVNIGSLNWFGNRVTVMKGTITPNNFIVASNSLCNKDYTIYPEYSIIGGLPAKLIGKNKSAVFSKK